MNTKTKRTVKTSEEIQRALTLRAAGYSLQSISQKTSISPSTLTRHFSKLGISKGLIDVNAVDLAKQQLLNDSGFINGLKDAIASAIIDDLSHGAALREAIALTLELLMKDTDTAPTNKAKGIASLSNALALTQKTNRIALQADHQPIEQESLPELYIRELTKHDIELLRRQQIESYGIKNQPVCEENNVIETIN
jgi:AraC-like DNA-binding protein